MKTIGNIKMGRRRFLKSLSIAGAVATIGISGCVSEPEPTPAPTMPTTRTPGPLPATATPAPAPTPAPKILPVDDDYYMTLIKTTLIEESLNVTSAHILRGEYITKAGLYIIDGRGEGKSEERALFLTYISNVSTKANASTKEEFAIETGSITHTFVELVRDGWDVDAIIVAVGDIKNNIIGTWHCEGFWVRNYLEGRIKRDTLYAQIMNTHKFVSDCHAAFSTLEATDCHAF